MARRSLAKAVVSSHEGGSLPAPSGFQLSGSAPELYQRYGVAAIGTAKAQELVTLAALQPGERVLDVACGTGVVTHQAAQAVGSTGQVAGLDINDGMLQVARTVTPPAGAPITWREGSVLALPFPEATFDVVLCQWGLEFFPDRAHGLRGQLQHARLSTKARTSVSSSRGDMGVCRQSRVPSARDSASCIMAVGWEAVGAAGTSTKPSGRGAATCGGASCFFRSVRRNRNCLATRVGGKVAAKATA